MLGVVMRVHQDLMLPSRAHGKNSRESKPSQWLVILHTGHNKRHPKKMHDRLIGPLAEGQSSQFSHPLLVKRSTVQILFWMANQAEKIDLGPSLPDNLVHWSEGVAMELSLVQGLGRVNTTCRKLARYDILQTMVKLNMWEVAPKLWVLEKMIHEKILGQLDLFYPRIPCKGLTYNPFLSL
jgi:hypothetical protein